MNQKMTFTVTLPSGLVDDLPYFVETCGFHSDSEELVADSVRGLFMEVIEDGMESLSQWADDFENTCRVCPDRADLNVIVTEELHDAIQSTIAPMGYGFWQFVGMALERSFSVLHTYCEDAICSDRE